VTSGVINVKRRILARSCFQTTTLRFWDGLLHMAKSRDRQEQEENSMERYNCNCGIRRLSYILEVLVLLVYCYMAYISWYKFDKSRRCGYKPPRLAKSSQEATFIPNGLRKLTSNVLLSKVTSTSFNYTITFFVFRDN
jgi:hypothetical protein